MMQSCASAAKLRRAGPFYMDGTKAMGGYGTLPPRIVIGNLSPRRRHAEWGYLSWFTYASVVTLDGSGDQRVAEQAHALGQLAGGSELPERDQQLAGKRYDHHLPGRFAPVLGAREKPLGQSTVLLVREEAPGEFDECVADTA